MKYADKTAGFTQFVVRLCYILLAATAITFPFIIKAGTEEADIFKYLSAFGKLLIAPFYLVVPAGFAALISLDKLLSNVKRDVVFDERNIRLLNILTYSCVYAMAVGVISFIIILMIYVPLELLIVLAAAEGFMALVTRVVRNVFKKAIEIKEDNDLVV